MAYRVLGLTPGGPSRLGVSGVSKPRAYMVCLVAKQGRSSAAPLQDLGERSFLSVEQYQGMGYCPKLDWGKLEKF